MLTKNNKLVSSIMCNIFSVYIKKKNLVHLEYKYMWFNILRSSENNYFKFDWQTLLGES